MLFPTVQYALFFLAVLLGHGVCAAGLGPQAFLLAASYVFYGFWNWSYVPLLFRICLVSGLLRSASRPARPGQIAQVWLTRECDSLPCDARLLQIHRLLFDDGFAIVGTSWRDSAKACAFLRRCCRSASRSLSSTPFR